MIAVLCVIAYVLFALFAFALIWAAGKMDDKMGLK